MYNSFISLYSVYPHSCPLNTKQMLNEASFTSYNQGCDHKITLGAEKAKNRNFSCIFLLYLLLKTMMPGAEFSPKAEKSHPCIILITKKSNVLFIYFVVTFININQMCI